MTRIITRPAAASHSRRFGLIILAVTAGLFGLAKADAPAAQAAPTPNNYALVSDVTTATFANMVDFALIPGTTDQAVVITQHEARVRRVSLTGGSCAPTPCPDDYGNLSDRVKTAGFEEGLLSIAFPPNFNGSTGNGQVYVYYTSLACTAPVTRCSKISRFQVVNHDMVTLPAPGSETVILEVNQELAADNHNGGRILFGPDSYLYSSIGDGGGGGDPLETGQDHTDLLGALLRINVIGQPTYTVPADNPFVGLPGADEVWAYGLRNPWRYSFDRVGGDLWMADVGQGAWEEVEEIVRGGNYGWDCYEGNAVFETAGCTTPPTPFIFPRAVYDHGAGCSVTGGYVYRGTALADIYGWYVYGDYCSGTIWAVNPVDTSSPVQLVDTAFNIGSFAELPNGELLVLRLGQPGGTPGIYRLTCAATPDTDGDGQGNACDLDDDNDAWGDGGESIIGTDPLDGCPDNTADNAWPPDINNDRTITFGDIGLLTSIFGQTVPPAPVRRDVAEPPNALINFGDIGRLTSLFGQTCGP
jgi:glucose/arabinose dehydrogenase